ncbi:hypothetical protein B0H13DRAFT_2232035 [Mycena leptocephala]|nr:hypothetical protein B0H13DRAFT_2232035 [Mycena leptocephala]
MDTISIPPAFEWPVQFCVFTTVVTYVLSVITSNVSQVDRLWTFLPTIYTAYFALLPLWPQQQAFTSLRAVLHPFRPAAAYFRPRLSYNTYRRGLFSLKDEDYRWAVLRAQLHPVLFQIVNLTFISAIQNVLLSFSASHPPQELGPSDYGVIQYAYQSFKHESKRYHKYHQWIGARLDWTPADAERGFLTRGLWAWSRHPNFACEQSIRSWIPPRPCHRPTRAVRAVLLPVTPALALSALFFSSTLYTEAITASKYPGYAAPLETIMKGVGLGLTGKKTAVEKVVWGSEKD